MPASAWHGAWHRGVRGTQWVLGQSGEGCPGGPWLNPAKAPTDPGVLPRSSSALEPPGPCWGGSGAVAGVQMPGEAVYGCC